MTTEESDIYTLGLNEHRQLTRNTAVRRVPGGWIYITKSDNSVDITSCFVPYCDEFKYDTGE